MTTSKTKPRGRGRPRKDDQRDDIGDYHKARARKEAALATLREMEVKRQKGELIPSEVVTREWQGVFMNVRARLLQLPTQIAQTVAPLSKPTECATAAQIIVHEALEELVEIVTYSEPVE